MRRGRMNATEARFAAEVLDVQRRACEIDEYDFEPMKFKIAEGVPADPSTGQKAIPPSYYTPDFVARSCEFLTAYEIKGFWRESARLRLKVAAERYKIVQFVSVQRNKGVWIYERFS